MAQVLQSEQRSSRFHIEPVDPEAPPVNSSKALLIAILDRAYRDLHLHSNMSIVRYAVAWFYSYETHFTSFRNICIELELSKDQVEFLLNKAKAADDYGLRHCRESEKNKFKAKREESRERMGRLLQGERRIKYEPFRPI